MYIANLGLRALLKNENQIIREAHLIKVLREYVHYSKRYLKHYAEENGLKRLVDDEIVIDFKQFADDSDDEDLEP